MADFKYILLIFCFLELFSIESFSAARDDTYLSYGQERSSSSISRQPLLLIVSNLPHELAQNIFLYLDINSLKYLRESKNRYIQEIATEALVKHPRLSITVAERTPKFFAFLNRVQMRNPSLGIRSLLPEDDFLKFSEEIAQAPNSFQLQAVTDLSFGGFPNLAVLVESILPIFSNLMSLKLPEHGIINFSLREIVRAAPNLRRLFIPNPDNCCFCVSVGGLGFVLSELKKLTHLDLSSHTLGEDEDIAEVFSAFHDCQLQHLVLSDAGVGDEGAREIAAIGSLRYLDLSNNSKITALGVEDLIAGFSQHFGCLHLEGLLLPYVDMNRFARDPRLGHVKSYFFKAF